MQPDGYITLPLPDGPVTVPIYSIPPGHPLHPDDVCMWVVGDDICAAPVSARKCSMGHHQFSAVTAPNEPGELS
jgi:hypothetical protein